MAERIRLNPTADGFTLAVEVVPGASRDRIAGPYGGGIKLAVSQVPQDGAANAAVVALLADRLQVAPAHTHHARGFTN